MRVAVINANIYDTQSRCFFPGALLTENGIIMSVIRDQTGDGADSAADVTVDAGGACVIPGFVDVHTHGRAGYDFNTADDAQLGAMARSYALAGTTSLFPTLASASFPSLLDAARLIRSHENDGDGAYFAGIHLEGRYLNPAKRGAHNPEFLVAPDADELTSFMSAAGLPLHISAALELDTDGGFASRATESGATLGLAHTCATYSEAMRAYRMYNVSFTHLYNAMPPLHHRDGGPVLAALTCGGYAELICDGFHIDRDIVSFTYKNVGGDRLVLVSDSMAAAGSPDGDYFIAGTAATVRGGIARTPDGALAGSTLCIRDALENLARFCGITLTEALPCATANPAAEVGLTGRVGVLAPGARADFLICEPDEGRKKVNIRRIFVGGREIT